MDFVDVFNFLNDIGYYSIVRNEWRDGHEDKIDTTMFIL